MVIKSESGWTLEGQMYDALSSDYDRFVNWQDRLAVELPFLIRKITLNSMPGWSLMQPQELGCMPLHWPVRISSGWGRSQPWDGRSSAHETQNLPGFKSVSKLRVLESLAQTFGVGSFDAVLCLGNSLPHLLSRLSSDRP